MSTVAEGFEVEARVRELSDEIRRLEGEAADDKAAADALVDKFKAEGRSPLTDAAALEEVDRAYMAGDEKSEQAARGRAEVEKLLRWGSRDKPGRFEARREDALFKTAAEKILAHPVYAEALRSGLFMGGSPLGNMPAVEIAGRDDVIAALKMRSSIFRAATLDASPLIQPDARYFPPAAFPVYTPRIVDLVTSTTTNSDLVQYVEETVRTDVAAETALGVAYPEATYVYTPRQAAVADIGHWVPAHRSNLADAGQFQGLIEGRLEDGVRRRLDGQIVAGSGAGGNIKGILNTSGIGAIGRNGTANERVLEAIHRGITWVRINGFTEPDAIAVYPSDYEKAVFEKGSDGQYLLGPAAASTSRTIWGFPASITTAVPVNTALVGNYKAGAILWVRSGVTTRVGDQHEDFFVKRMVAILAEMRAAFAAWVPSDFAAVDLT